MIERNGAWEATMLGETSRETPRETKPKRQPRRPGDTHDTRETRDSASRHTRPQGAQGLREVMVGKEPGLTLAAVAAVARRGAAVSVAPAALERVRAARAFVEQICVEDRVVYGVTTGFGKLSSVKIAPEQLAELQR